MVADWHTLIEFCGFFGTHTIHHYEDGSIILDILNDRFALVMREQFEASANVRLFLHGRMRR